MQPIVLVNKPLPEKSARKAGPFRPKLTRKVVMNDTYQMKHTVMFDKDINLDRHSE